jgi:zinc D-Ala-D-Ala carboxypeptidase
MHGAARQGGNMTEHFTLSELSRSETAIRKGINNIIPAEYLPNAERVAKALEIVRAEFGPVTVTSCYRGPELNRMVGGSPTSAHCFACAADFECSAPNIDVAQWCAANIPDYDQVIYEFGAAGWVHLGFTSGNPRKQTLTATKDRGKTVYIQGIKEVA